MNVLITHSTMQYGEAAASAFDLAEALRAEGHEVLVVTQQGSAFDRRITARGLQMRRLNFQGAAASGWHNTNKLRDLIVAFRADVIHSHGEMDADFALRAREAAKRGIPVVWTCTGTSSASIPDVTTRVATSSAVATELARKSAGRIGNIVYPAVEIAMFDPARRSEAWRNNAGAAHQDILIGLLLNTIESQGVELLLRAASPILSTTPSVRVVIGSRYGLQFERLARIADEFGVSDKVILEDVVENIPSMLASLDIGVVFGQATRSALEYMASGTPVIAENATATAEIMNPGTTGMLVPSGDAGALTLALLHLINSADQRATISSAALSYVRENHDRQQWIMRILEIYESASVAN